MGTIRIGRVGKKSFAPDASSVQKPAETMSDEQLDNLLEAIKRMPKDKWVGAMRSAGLDALADEYERELAEEHLREMEKDVLGSERVAEEPLPEIVQTEDSLGTEKTDEGNGEENQPVDASVGGEENTLSEEEPKVKPSAKRGRKRSSRMK